MILKLGIISLFIFIVTDVLWLGFIAQSWYFTSYQNWLRLSGGQLYPLWWAVIIVYLLCLSSINVFVFPLAKDSILAHILYGAFLGCIIYGVYNLTCLAIFKDWPWVMSVIDWCWGMFLFAWTAAITKIVSNNL